VVRQFTPSARAHSGSNRDRQDKDAFDRARRQKRAGALVPGRPKHAKLLATLRGRAQQEFGDGSSELDYVLHWLRDGGTILSLAARLQNEMGESVSRSFLSGSVHRLSRDAKDQIEAARRDGAHALIEQTITIADQTPPTANDAHKAKLAIGVRQWMAERYNREDFGNARPDVVISLGTLHLDALRQRAISAKATLITDGTLENVDDVE
jgi:hypothetical protein